MTKGKPPSDKQVAVGTAVVTGVAAAGASFLGPEAALAAAGITPVIADRLNSLYSNRVRRALESLAISEEALTEGPVGDLKIELIRDYCAAQFSTRSEAKFEMLRQATQNGLSADTEREVAYAKRIVRIIDFLDDHEVQVLAAIFTISQSDEDASAALISQKLEEGDSVLVQASLSSLTSTGLISRSSSDVKSIELTEFGHVLVAHL